MLELSRACHFESFESRICCIYGSSLL